MLLLLFGLSIVLVVIGICFYDSCDLANYIGVVGIYGVVIVLLVSIIPAIMLTSSVFTVEPKIEMYQAENSKIETEISDIVKSYAKYEQRTFTDTKSESPVTLVSMYPELKTNTLVSKQIEIYVRNNDKIKEMKEDKIGQKMFKWWLYFGG